MITIRNNLILKSNTKTLSKKKLLELEQYFNNKVASDVFEKFKVGVRLHVKDTKKSEG